MKYYIETIEQTLIDETLNEYAKVEKYDTLQSATTNFYQKLANVSADIGKNHTYMNIKVVNSFGVVVKEDTIGVYQPEAPTLNAFELEGE